MTCRTILTSIVACLVLATPAAAHLLVTEVGYDPVDETSPTAEYVEILNPGPSAVALGDIWIVNDEDAYPLLVNGPVLAGVTSGDFLYRFPNLTLDPGGIVVVCQDSDAFLAEHFPVGGMADFLAQPGSQTLVEVTSDGAADGVPDLADWGSNPAGTLSMANNGECVGLVFWDGASDRVVDHDWVCWLTLNAIPDKDVDYPLGVDGPDPNLDVSFFGEDRGTALAAPDAPQGSSIHRASLFETSELQSGGNGASGHDETTEDWSGWLIQPFSPGVVTLSTVGVPGAGTPHGSGLDLRPGVPNPFQSATTLSYSLPTDGHVRLAIHDVGGRAVATLVDGAETAGSHTRIWDGRRDDGRPVAAGVYFVRLDFGGEVRSLRISRMR